MTTTWLDARDVEESELQLGEEIGSGGQGQVLRVLGQSMRLVYKRYKVAGADPDALKLLVDLPSSLPPADRERLLRLSAWPLARVVQKGKVSGFLMQEIPSQFRAPDSRGAIRTRELQYLLYDRKPTWGGIVPGEVSAAIRVGVAREFATLLKLLHDESLVVGDVSMTNVLWAPGDLPSIFLIDCDGIRRLGAPPVLPQADTPEWEDPEQPADGPDLDSDRYKLALLISRVLCKAPYLRPGEELQLVPDIPGSTSLKVNDLWTKVNGPRSDRPHAADWVAALNYGAKAPASPPVSFAPIHLDRAAPRKARVLAGRYEFEDQLGAGAMGSVWKAFDVLLERTVALKKLVAERAVEDRAVGRERMRREALALARVEHPVVVGIYDLIFEGDDPWIVMPYIRGRSLQSIISDSPPLDEPKVASIGLAVLDALLACHERHVYHRNIKPTNILLSDNGKIHLVGFGISQIGDHDPLTPSNAIVGTPEFLAPELINRQKHSAGTDLWELGVTLYYALEGRSPFRAETIEGTIAAILSRNPPEPRTGGELAALILAMLRKDPTGRPDAATVSATLRRIADRAEDSPIQAARQSPQDAGGIRTTRPVLVLAPLDKMPAPDAARVVTDWPADRAVASLLSLRETQAAQIINLCDDPVAGKLLSAIAADYPAQARRFLEMVTAERAGRLLDHMSSAAAASALSLPPAAGAVRALARASDLTAVGVLLEMRAPNAADLVMAIESERAMKLLAKVPPATLADLLRNILPARRQALMNRLPTPLRSLVASHL